MIRRLRVKLVCVLMAVAAALLCVLFGTVLHFTRSGLKAFRLQAGPGEVQDRKSVV